MPKLALHKANNRPNAEIRDPALTEAGKQECRDFARDFVKLNAPVLKPQLKAIFCSPMMRTMETACICFESVPRRHKYGSSIATACPELQNFDTGLNGTGLGHED
ncbi:hypothetical protein NHQ30_007303 [Ciborinia camelliae]|nr:hypothetical protein NHQ30_007303 [Ciborinia camelliae]